MTAESNPSTVEPSTVGPSTVGPSTVGPSTVGPPTVGPSTVGPGSIGDSQRLRHTIAVLQSVRGVHRLLARERDLARLLQAICDCLTEHPGSYESAWVALFFSAADRSPLVAGAGPSFVPLEAPLDAEKLPLCAQQAHAENKVFVVADSASCDCPLAERARGKGTIAAPLIIDGQARGVLCASLPHALVNAPKEAGFFGELAEDIAYALGDLEREQRGAGERRRLEERLRQSEKMEAMGQLANGVAHDFNNQLTGIMGHATLLSRSLVDNVALSEHAEIIIKSCRSAADLNQKLLAFGRRGKLRRIAIDMHALIREVMQLLSRSIDKRIDLETRPLAERAIVRGDPSQLQNALLNVMLNARDAMPSGGLLVVSTDEVTLDETSLEAQPNVDPGAFLRIRVRDDGIGMERPTLARVFEPFFTTKPEGKGTGMGLASVYGTVKRHGGLIDVDSALGRGTTLDLLLPLAEAATIDVGPPKDRAKTGMPRAAGAHTVLVVDDEDTVRELMRQMLEGLGYAVVTCNDGLAAVDALRSCPAIDVAILDVMMPEIGGPETLHRLRTIDRGLPVIVTSGYSVRGDVQRMLDEGALDFLPKPFGLDELAERVAAVLRAISD